MNYIFTVGPTYPNNTTRQTRGDRLAIDKNGQLRIYANRTLVAIFTRWEWAHVNVENPTEPEKKK